MGISKFQIVFDKPSKKFKSNQTVTGRVFLNLNAPLKMRALIMHFKGETLVKWDETRETKNSQGDTVYETVNHVGNEIYFENKYNMAGGPSGEMILQANDYSYSFNIFLPPNLPNSYEGKYGGVHYTAKAIIDMPGCSNAETQEKFTVICPFDLKEHKAAKEPVKKEEEHFFCCCCCESGPLTVVVSLPAAGYVPGQEIPITVEVDNVSQESVSEVTATLHQSIKFHATSPEKSSKSEETTVKRITFGPVEPNGSQTWTKSIPIPMLPASDLLFCSIIKIKYELNVIAEVDAMCHSNVSVDIPVTIGTIPLEGVTIPEEFIIDNADDEITMEIGGNVNNLEAGHGQEMRSPSPGIGFQVPGGGPMAMPMPFPGHAQPAYPPPYPAGGMQPMYMQPSPGMQPNMGYQPGMPPYAAGQPGANVMPQQVGAPYNFQPGNYGQPNMGGTSPYNMQYQSVAGDVPAVHGQPPSATQYTYQNASAPPI